MIADGFVVSTLGLGVIFSILAFIVERLLVKSGLVQGNPIGLLVAVLFVSFLMYLADSSNSVWLYCLLIVLIAPFSVNRSDIVTTLRKGRWWWKRENRDGS